MPHIGYALCFLSMALLANGQDYHDLFGIPAANRIKQIEFSMTRLIGGVAVSPSDYPYMCGLLMNVGSGVSVCGCSVLSKTVLLTAAHCTARAITYTAVLGSARLYSGGLRITATLKEIHQDYDATTLNNDVALLSIAAVKFTDNIQPIKLAQGDNDYAGTLAVAVGYGKTSDSEKVIPRGTSRGAVKLLVISNTQCRRTYQARYVGPGTLCAGGGGPATCSGDSGGPLVVGSWPNATLIGITSFGSTRGCELGLPSGFTRVSYYRQWVLQRL